MPMSPSSFYPALSTHVQDGMDKHGHFENLGGFMMELSNRLAKINAAIQAASSPPSDPDVIYRIHQTAAVCVKALCQFDMNPRNAKPPAGQPKRDLRAPGAQPPPTVPA